jgi:hypothetical protein
MNRWNRRDRRSHKRLDHGDLPLSVMPWKTAAAFGQMETILAKLEQTGDIDDEVGTPVFKVASRHEWFELAPAFEGFAAVYELHARLSGREMDTAPLRQIAKKFKYEVMIFQSDVDMVRAALKSLHAETLTMTLNYSTALIRTVQEAA